MYCGTSVFFFHLVQTVIQSNSKASNIRSQEILDEFIEVNDNGKDFIFRTEASISFEEVKLEVNINTFRINIHNIKVNNMIAEGLALILWFYFRNMLKMQDLGDRPFQNSFFHSLKCPSVHCSLF